MATERRIVIEVSRAIQAPACKDPERTCQRLIMLDGVSYRCGRELCSDGTHGGVHDAFAVHSDLGLVRW